MQLKAGNILVSSSTIEDDYFKGSAIFLTEYNECGAIGFVFNKRATRPLNALLEFRYSPAFSLYEGGPVAADELFFLHRRADLISGGMPINEELFIGGNFKQAIALISKGTIVEEDMKIFIGYCGWENGDLEAEIAEGSWRVAQDNYRTIF